MDTANYRDCVRIFGGDPQGKVHKLKEYIGESGDIADPWYTRNFRATYEELLITLNAFYEKECALK